MLVLNTQLISSRLSEPGLSVFTAAFLILYADPKQRCQEESRSCAAFEFINKFKELGRMKKKGRWNVFQR
jgi:hypothetical protein